MKVCSLYGAGFWYVPGTNTCIKIGSYIRAQMEWEASGGLIYRNGATGNYTRTDSPGLEHRIRGVISADTRTQTDYGTLRGYVRLGAEQTTPGTSTEAVFFDRGFIQFGGLTVGRADSFFDFFSMARYNYINNFTSSNMGATGQFVLGYTFQFGNGISASIAIEDGGAEAAGTAGSGGRGRGKTTIDLNQGTFLSATGGSITTDNGAYAMPDIVANVRIDQAWGSAQVMGALHQNRGGYYGSALGCGVGAAVNTTGCGYPSDELGWAVGAGVIFNNVFGLAGDSISAQINYGQGAAGYIQRTTGAWRIWGSGPNLAIGSAVDSVFGCTAAVGCSGLELTESWGVSAGAEHRWNAQWKTSIYGGYLEHNYNGAATNLICTVPGATAGFTIAGGAAQCNPDFSMWNIGTRTQWNPHPYLDIGVDVMYWNVNTAFAGAGTTTAASGARPASAVTFEDQEGVSVFGRIQYNFLP